jgi:hypothetical protein
MPGENALNIINILTNFSHQFPAKKKNQYNIPKTNQKQYKQQRNGVALS